MQIPRWALELKFEERDLWDNAKKKQLSQVPGGTR
jgi:hypothetical protein